MTKKKLKSGIRHLILYPIILMPRLVQSQYVYIYELRLSWAFIEY